ncbi:DUF1294 domain-containing protein [Methanoculleus sp. FWC-SCC1]|uniref:DUF1294 domain-containing protein n=1 Tax=Methanoculleus frigidifontis TaxID=2584085 RepID=A0ABT8M8J9_9EURY|nr:DUF1294 domain-containing protein [Methanoculleus sp. FWC-SCC1]MDN7024263.1 DUF1294 domain-containing protein [Methanoculleus sp. FWC-SCC1]
MTAAYLPFFLIIYALLNAGAYLLFARDKRKAEGNAWRTPETTLLLSALFGPFGAYAAMRRFRHKTRKTKFVLVPVFAVMHTAVILWILVSLV